MHARMHAQIRMHDAETRAHTYTRAHPRGWLMQRGHRWARSRASADSPPRMIALLFPRSLIPTYLQAGKEPTRAKTATQTETEKEMRERTKTETETETEMRARTRTRMHTAPNHSHR